MVSVAWQKVFVPLEKPFVVSLERKFTPKRIGPEGVHAFVKGLICNACARDVATRATRHEARGIVIKIAIIAS